MYQFSTASGTLWTVDAHRITRHPDPYKPPEVTLALAPAWTNQPFRWVTPPVVGGYAFFRIPGERGIHRTGLVTRFLHVGQLARVPGSVRSMAEVAS